MTSKGAIPFRSWRETPPLERLPRIAVFAGVAIFAVFWSIAVVLQGQALAQPSVPSGIYQYAYHLKGTVRFLTVGQARFAHTDIGMVGGWLLGAVGGLTSFGVEYRAARAKLGG